MYPGVSGRGKKTPAFVPVHRAPRRWRRPGVAGYVVYWTPECDEWVAMREGAALPVDIGRAYAETAR